MRCIMCSCDVEEADHIALDSQGEPQVLCDECYDKARIFFEEVKRRGKTQS